jgi:hypothetical protein
MAETISALIDRMSRALLVEGDRWNVADDISDFINEVMDDPDLDESVKEFLADRVDDLAYYNHSLTGPELFGDAKLDQLLREAISFLQQT